MFVLFYPFIHSPLHPFRFFKPVLGDINSRCKITTFFAHKCAHIKKKCVKIDTFAKKCRART